MSAWQACRHAPRRDLVLMVSLQDKSAEDTARADQLLFGAEAEARGVARAGVSRGARARERRIEELARGVGARVVWVEEINSPHEQMVGREDLRAAYSKLHVRKSRLLQRACGACNPRGSACIRARPPLPANARAPSAAGSERTCKSGVCTRERGCRGGGRARGGV